MRNFLNALPVVLLWLVAVSMVDVGVYALIDLKGPDRVLSGQAIAMSGQIDEPIDTDIFPRRRTVANISDPGVQARREDLLNRLLTAETGSPHITIRFKELDGRIWRGELKAGAAVEGGDYSCVVYRTAYGPSARSQVRDIRVFEDRDALDADFWSPTRRYLGFAPWWITFAGLGAVLALVPMFYARETREERRLQGLGIGVIFRIKPGRGERAEIWFSLGQRQGVRAGQELNVLDQLRAAVLGTLQVLEVRRDYARGLIEERGLVDTECFVAGPDQSRSQG